MLNDSQYLSDRPSEITHKYGPNFHILGDSYLFTILARLCNPATKQPLINQLLNTLYAELVKEVINNEFPLKEATLKTRMSELHPEGTFRANVIDPEIPVVCVNLARAGTLPSQICFDSFNYLFNPDRVRQDHISINRKTDENNQVIGTDLGGVKIGGDITDSIVVFPDPMGATGHTIETALEIYQKRGTAKKNIAMHLIVTPEYLAKIKTKFPKLIVYAIRLDRGLSPEKVLSTVPGTHWSEEKGLNQNQYIVPGAGGLGEVINNAYV